MRKLEDRRLPPSLRLEVEDNFGDEEKAIIAFVNGDIDIHGFVAALQEADKQTNPG